LDVSSRKMDDEERKDGEE